MRRAHATAAALLAVSVLFGCTRAKDVLDPSAITPPAPQGDAMSTETPPVSPAQSAAVLAKTRLQIAPIVGATVEAATPLTDRLAIRARERGITLAGSQAPTHMIKGYFSAVTEGSDTTVIYVWDVYDPAGNRLHRINGQQKAPSVKGGQEWSAVSPSTMQAIADATIDQLAAWLGTQTG